MSDSPREDKKSDALYAAGIAVMLVFMSGDFTYNALGLLVMVCWSREGVQGSWAERFYCQGESGGRRK